MPNIEVSIKIDYEKVAKAFREAPRELGRRLGIAISQSAFTIERESKIEAPVDTGRLRGSIATQIKPLSALISPNTEYAIFVHEGTRFMKARPFMVKGVEASVARIEDFFTRAVEDTIAFIGS